MCISADHMTQCHFYSGIFGSPLQTTTHYTVWTGRNKKCYFCFRWLGKWIQGMLFWWHTYCWSTIAAHSDCAMLTGAFSFDSHFTCTSSLKLAFNSISNKCLVLIMGWPWLSFKQQGLEVLKGCWKWEDKWFLVPLWTHTEPFSPFLVILSFLLIIHQYRWCFVPERFFLDECTQSILLRKRKRNVHLG